MLAVLMIGDIAHGKPVRNTSLKNYSDDQLINELNYINSQIDSYCIKKTARTPSYSVSGMRNGPYYNATVSPNRSPITSFMDGFNKVQFDKMVSRRDKILKELYNRGICP